MSANCPQLSSYNATNQFVGKDNFYDVFPSTFNLSHGTTVSVRCTGKLELTGQATFTCQNGVWDYTIEPRCIDAVNNAETDGLDTETKILIGVVSGVVALIVIILLILMFCIWHTTKQRRDEPLRDNDYRSRSDGRISTVEMYTGRSAPYDKRSHAESYGGHRSRSSDLGSRVYLPRDNDRDRRDFRRSRKSARYDDNFSDPGKKPYVRDWVSRSSRNSMTNSYDDMLDRPSVHGGGSRDSHLWRNT